MGWNSGARDWILPLRLDLALGTTLPEDEKLKLRDIKSSIATNGEVSKLSYKWS